MTYPRKSSGVFRATRRDTLALLGEEIERLDGESPTAFPIDVQESALRLTGMLRANARVGALPGAVLSFKSRYRPLRTPPMHTSRNGPTRRRAGRRT